MDSGRVVVYFAKLGGRLQKHQRVMLMKDAETIAGILAYGFDGEYSAERSFDGATFYVPDDSLLPEEASALGIQHPEAFYGGVVPFPFVKTKVISHGLFNCDATHPAGWSVQFTDRVKEVVLGGYTAFSHEDVRRAATHLLADGAVRLKSPLGASGKGQNVVGSVADLDRLT